MRSAKAPRNVRRTDSAFTYGILALIFDGSFRRPNVPSSAASAHAGIVKVMVTSGGPKSAGATSWATRYRRRCPCQFGPNSKRHAPKLNHRAGISRARKPTQPSVADLRRTRVANATAPSRHASASVAMTANVPHVTQSTHVMFIVSSNGSASRAKPHARS